MELKAAAQYDLARQLGFMPGQESQLIQSFDANGSGALEFEEFASLLLQIKYGPLWMQLDYDGDGVLDYVELKAASADPTESSAIMRAFDRDGSGLDRSHAPCPHMYYFDLDHES